MNIEEAAFINLVSLARADGTISPPEMELLDHYGKALGIPEERAREIIENDSLQPVDSASLGGEASDRTHIFKLMIRVACADGRIAYREKRLLKRIARSFGIGRVAYRSLFLEIEEEQGIRKRLRLSRIVTGTTIVLAAAAIWFAVHHFSGTAADAIDGTRIDLDALREELGLDRAKAEEARRLVRASQKRLTRDEAELKKRLEALARETADKRTALQSTLTREQKTRQTAMQAEIDRLRGELTRLRGMNAVFKDFEREFGRSILLIFTSYDLVSGQDRLTRGSMGTGFFVSSGGLLVTNKHVVQPWKFSGEENMLFENGFSLDEASITMAAWPAGTDVKTAGGNLNLDAAFSTLNKTLALEKTTPDTLEERSEPLSMGILYRGNLHTIDNGDLALLRASSPAPVRALPIEEAASRLEKLDPVMVLGFPVGINILETAKAETSPSLGEVRKIEKSIMVTAPIVFGNSGGPLIDVRGKVVGVASKIFGEATLGSCIPARHIMPLLPSAPDLVKEVRAHESAGRFRAALDDLRLAQLRCADKKERTEVGEARTRLLAIRDEMMDRARKVGDEAGKKKALQDLVDRFGPHWAEEAVELLKGLRGRDRK